MPLKEATIKAARARAGGILNSAIATFQEAPLPVRLITYGVVGGGTIAILSGCGAQSQPCEILPTETPDQKGGSCPIAIFSYNPKQIVSLEDQASLKEKYGSDIKTLYQWMAVNKGSGTENKGDGAIAFSTYTFENGRSMVVFPSGKEDYNSGETEAHEYTTSWFETADGKILYSYNYQDKLNPEKAISFFSIEYKKPDGATLEDIIANPSKLLGNPSRVIISNPPANEEIVYNIDSQNQDDKKLIEAISSLFVREAHALGAGTATPSPSPTTEASKTPVPATATATSTATEIPATAIPVTMEELRITDPALIKAFNGIGKFLTPEGGKFTATIGGEKYTLDGEWNLNAELNNFYAPATVKAVDAQGNQVVLIWNKEGLSVNTPLSADIENPTGFSDATKLTTLQRFLLQNPDPFTKRSDALRFNAQKTKNGIVVSLRTDVPEIADKLSNVWLRYTDPNGEDHLVNPLNLNTADGRIVNMCDYGKIGTGTGDKALRKQFMERFNITKVIWPILKADESFFKNFQQPGLPIQAFNASDLNDLLTLKGNRPSEDLVDRLTPQGDGLVSFSAIIRDLYNHPDLLKVGDGYELLIKQSGIIIDPKIQLMILPCQIW